MMGRVDAPQPKLEILQGDNLEILRSMPDEAFQLIYVDPPFNTGKRQRLRSLRTRRRMRLYCLA